MLNDRIAFDLETELIEKGNVAPRLVCMSLHRFGHVCQLFSRLTAPTILRSYLVDPAQPLLIGHNVAFDLGVLATEDETLVPLVFEAYRTGRVRDTGVREKLLLIRAGAAVDGKHTPLAELATKYTSVALDKGADSWRYWYGDLRTVTNTDLWPPEAREYAMQDATTTLAAFDAQQTAVEGHPSWVDATRPASTISPDEILQTRAAWVLHLMKMWGFRTDAAAVAELKADLTVKCAEAEERLFRYGLYKIAGTKKAPKRSKDMAEIKRKVIEACQARGVPVPMTAPSTAHPNGQVVTDRETLADTGDPALVLLAESGSDAKLLSTFIPLVEAGTKVPITPSWNTLVRTGRTSCGSPDDPGNFQNPPRKSGIRACVRARPGHVFGSVDFEQFELVTLSQVLLTWFGKSHMADAIRAGRDLHIDLACNADGLLKGVLDYDAAVKGKKTDPRVKNGRQFGKVANFGFPGGLGADTFIAYAHGYMDADGKPLKITRGEAQQLKAAYLRQWPEMPHYFDRITHMVNSGAPMIQLSGRVRGGADFCAAANTMFQGLAADAAKEAIWQTAWECYVDAGSALFGSRIVLFLHDEIIIESPEDVAPEATDRLAVVMVAAAQRYIPDVPVKAEPTLMRSWHKDASMIRDATGRLMVWEPKGKAA